MSRVLLVALALLPLCACTGHDDDARPDGMESPLPSTCASDALTVTVDGRTEPLADCSGAVGRGPLPRVTAQVGDVVRVEGSPRLALRSLRPDVAAVDGLRVRALRPGTTSVSAERGAACAPPAPPAEGPQPLRCLVLTLVVVP